MVKQRLKKDPDSELWIEFIIDEGVDEYGRHWVKTQWARCKEDFSLGSIKKPCQERIRSFEYRQKEPIKRYFFDNFDWFKGK